MSNNTPFELKQVSIRLAEEASFLSNERITSPQDAVRIIGNEISKFDREVMCVLNLTTAGQPINFSIVSMGAIDQTLASPREMFKASILSNAAQVIMLHNHPSGDVTPSKNDVMVTNRMIELFDKIGIQLSDHIIVGSNEDGKYYSFLNENMFYHTEQKWSADLSDVHFNVAENTQYKAYDMTPNKALKDFVPKFGTRKEDLMTLEERYTKAMKLAGYELIDTPPESPVGITFMKTFGGQTIGFDGWEMVGMELENLKPENELHQEEFERLIHPLGVNASVLSDDKLLSGSKDMYGIYQAKNTKENVDLLEQGLLHPLNENHRVYRENYNLIYVEDIYQHTTCEQLVNKIRTNPPKGFPENGISPGHIIAMSQGGNLEFYYVEEYGAVPVESFADGFYVEKEQYNNRSEEEIISMVLAIGRSTFDEINEYEPEYGLKVLNAKIYGSRENGNYKPDSDIDVLLEYEGDLKESEVFNLVNEAGISIAGMKLDINPIRAQESGTIEEFLQRDAERRLTEDQEKTVDVPVSKASLPNRLLVDMDGVLATFQQVDTLELLYEKNYFLNLEPVENVIEAVRLIKAEHPEIEVYILSSVLSDSEYALQEKNEWLDQYLPEIDAEHRLFPPCGVNKASYVPDGIGVTDFLLDDYTHNLTSWEPPARGIKLLNGINHTNETWNGNMLRFDKEPRELADNILSVMGGELIQDIKPQSDIDRFKTEFLKVLDDVKEIHKELENIQKNMKPKVMLETEQKKETVSPVIPRTKNKTSPKL